jgi:hypothetical protein
MAGKNTAVFGIYPNRASVDRAVDTLKVENFRNTDISVLFPENEGSKAEGWVGWRVSARWLFPA